MFTPTVCVQLMGVCCADPVVLFPVPHAGALPLPTAAHSNGVTCFGHLHSQMGVIMLWTALRRSWRMSWKTCMSRWTVFCLFCTVLWGLNTYVH